MNIYIYIYIYSQQKHCVNPLSPTSDVDKISPYTISKISSRQVMSIKKILIRRFLAGAILNSPN